MTRWFTSDMHFGHARINELAGRPFASVDEMDAAIVANWTDRVAADDEVWILGDVCMGRIVESLPTLAALPGIKTLVAGNHDRCWEGNGTRKMGRGLDHTGWVDVYLNEGGLAAVHTGNPGSIPLGAEGDRRATVVDVSHFPYADHRHDDRDFGEYQPVDVGRWLLHGHVHEAWRVNGRQINVGVDVWDFAPVAEETLLEIVVGGGEGPVP